MKKLQFFGSLILLLAMLSDPESGCFACESSVISTGILPDTTLILGSTWKINIESEMWIVSSCQRHQNKIDAFQSQGILDIAQTSDSLFITPLQKGVTRLTLTVPSQGGITNPEIAAQTIQIIVK